MKKTAPRISDQTADFYPHLFRTLNTGLEYVLESFPRQYQRALGEIKGIFGQGELSLIIDVFNATALTYHLAGQHLAIQVADSISLDGLDTKWEIDEKSILKKIDQLTSFQTDCLELWANSFWYSKESQDSELDLEAHLKNLI